VVPSTAADVQPVEKIISVRANGEQGTQPQKAGNVRSEFKLKLACSISTFAS